MGEYSRCASQYIIGAYDFAKILTMDRLVSLQGYYAAGEGARDPPSSRSITSLYNDNYVCFFSRGRGARDPPPPQEVLLPLTWKWLLVTPVGIGSRRARGAVFLVFSPPLLLLSRCRRSSASSGPCCTRLGCPRGSGPATTWRC